MSVYYIFATAADVAFAYTIATGVEQDDDDDDDDVVPVRFPFIAKGRRAVDDLYVYTYYFVVIITILAHAHNLTHEKIVSGRRKRAKAYSLFVISTTR